RKMRPLLSLLALSGAAQALFFYVDGSKPRCFVEELPKDTLVVGDYKAEEWDPKQKQWTSHDGLNIYISVDVRVSGRPPSYSHFLSASPAPHLASHFLF